MEKDLLLHVNPYRTLKNVHTKVVTNKNIDYTNAMNVTTLNIKFYMIDLLYVEWTRMFHTK